MVALVLRFADDYFSYPPEGNPLLCMLFILVLFIFVLFIFVLFIFVLLFVLFVLFKVCCGALIADVCESLLSPKLTYA